MIAPGNTYAILEALRADAAERAAAPALQQYLQPEPRHILKADIDAWEELGRAQNLATCWLRRNWEAVVHVEGYADRMGHRWGAQA